MKYRSISLNGNRSYTYSLVKYTKEYKSYLEELRKMNKILADYIETNPKIYSELSEHQSYMIFRDGYKCVGAINIETSSDEKNLKVEIQFDENSFDSQEEMLEVIEQIVESLKLYFFDKENVEIKLNNGIDLSKINSTKYQKKFYDENLTTYSCSNSQNNVLFARLIDEITGAEKNLTEWGQSWWQELQIANYGSDLQYSFDKKLLEEIDNGTITLQELFYKVETVLWANINSINATRTISFSRNGQVEFSKVPHRKNGINYEFKYNVLFNGFNLKINDFFRNGNLEIDENSHFTNIKYRALNILQIKENKRKRITFKTPIVDSSSISVELWTNEKDEIEKCYIDFRTHKGNGKINGIYALRLFAHNDMFSLRFISRKGGRYSDFSQVLACDDEELYSTILNGQLTMEIIDKLIKRVIPIINRKVTKSNNHSGNKKYIAKSNDKIIQSLLYAESQVFNFIKQIEGEIPLPYLQENLRIFIAQNDKNRKRNRPKALQNQVPKN